jgi:hypothetical protein
MTQIDTSTSRTLRGCAVTALLALALTGAATAQEQSGQGDQTATQPEQARGEQAGEGDQNQAQTAATGDATGDQGQAPANDQLVATVGEAEIRGADVLTVIGLLPEPLRAQQPDMLVPIALDQLVFRELILRQAREQNLSEDPEVQSLVQQSSADAEEDAMVQVWLRRELQNAVSDQAVQDTYDRLSQNAGGEVPPLEQIRSQIEQHLRQQALADLRQRLAQDVDIVLYDPSGQPMQQSQGGSAQDGGGQDHQQSAGGENQPVEGSDSGEEAGSGN